MAAFLERRDTFERFRSERDPGLVLGNGTTVYTWTTFNVDPTGCIEIGRDCVLVGAVFMCADTISLGDSVVISYNVTIADSDFHPIDPAERRLDAIANAPEATGLAGRQSAPLPWSSRMTSTSASERSCSKASESAPVPASAPVPS